MTNTSYPKDSDMLKLFKGVSTIPAHRVIRYGYDGYVHPAAWNSGSVFGVTKYECHGKGSGVTYWTPENPAIFTASEAIDSGEGLMVSPYTSHGLVAVALHETGTWATGEAGQSSYQIGKILNYVGFAIEAAAASGDTFRGWFSPRGM